MQSSPYTDRNNKRLLILIFMVMSAGTFIELLLLGHYEDQWQLVPIILVALGALTFLFNKLNSKWLTKMFRALMILCVISGVLGVWFHLKANIEFEKEMYPSISGWELVKESLSGAIPALAPGSMVPLGLLGYLFTMITSKQTNKQ